jgi:hypothetical protein
MMKRILYFLLLVVLYINLNGCAAVVSSLVVAVIPPLAGEAVKATIKSENSTTTNMTLGKELETYQINKEYTVKVNDGSFKEDAVIIFSVYDQDNNWKERISVNKDNADDMKIIDKFNQLDQVEKKKTLKRWFLNYTNFDLGDVEGSDGRVSQTTASTLVLGRRGLETSYIGQYDVYYVGKYEVRVSEGSYKDKPCILLAAYNSGKVVGSVYFEKNLDEDMKKIDDFNQKGLREKKLFLKDIFLKYSLDLGDVE